MIGCGMLGACALVVCMTSPGGCLPILWSVGGCGGEPLAPDLLPGDAAVAVLASVSRPLGMAELWAGGLGVATSGSAFGWLVSWDAIGTAFCQEHTVRAAAGWRAGRFRAGGSVTGTVLGFAGELPAAAADAGIAIALEATREVLLRAAGTDLAGRLGVPAAGVEMQMRYGGWVGRIALDADREDVRWRTRQNVWLDVAGNKVCFGCGAVTATRRRPPELAADVVVRRGGCLVGYTARWTPWFDVEHRVSVGFSTRDAARGLSDPPRRAARATVRSSATYNGPPVDLNTATAAELERLPGIGRVLARRIIAHRERVGTIRFVDEVRSVAGVSVARIAAFAPFVVVSTGGRGTYVPVCAADVPVPDRRASPVGERGALENTTHAAGDVATRERHPAVACRDTETQPRAAGSGDVSEADRLARLNRMTEREFSTAGFSRFDARNIVRYRDRQGGFSAVQQLYNVPNVDRRRVAAFLAGASADVGDYDLP